MEGTKDTLWNWLDLCAQNAPDTPAIIGPAAPTSYGELALKVRSTAGGLRALGLNKGDIVAVQLPNIEAYVVAFLAITACGGVVQTVHMPYRQAELQHLLAHSGARMAVGLSSFKDMSPAAEMLAMSKSLPNLEAVIAVGEPVEGAHAFSELLQADGDVPLPELSPDDPYLLLYTSGATASPNGVPHAYRGFLGNAARCAEQLGIGADEKMLSVAPYTHLYGLFVMHMCLATGAAQALLPAFDPRIFLPTLSELKPNAFSQRPRISRRSVQPVP
ncbi:MAG: acyl--CoA ligase [Hyphomicrobiales bacterium]|nr:acyl--CoA ligase [Hyphomicrobiales bacterium]MCP4997546.1 acyl--CoA ligase [Hyphomicrobiales bacterium]